MQQNPFWRLESWQAFTIQGELGVSDGSEAAQYRLRTEMSEKIGTR